MVFEDPSKVFYFTVTNSERGSITRLRIVEVTIVEPRSMVTEHESNDTMRGLIRRTKVE